METFGSSICGAVDGLTPPSSARINLALGRKKGEATSASKAHEEPDSEPTAAVNAEAMGRRQGGLSTKIHALADALGNPIGFYLTLGQACDLEGSDIFRYFTGGSGRSDSPSRQRLGC